MVEQRETESLLSAESVRYLNCGLIISVLFLTFAPNAAAESAKEQLQGTIDHVIEVLRTIQGPEDIERNRNSLRQILLTRFDFAAMAEKSLGNHWKDLNGKEEEFVSAFTDFVEHSYMSTLGSYQGEKGGRGHGEVADDHDHEGRHLCLHLRPEGADGWTRHPGQQDHQDQSEISRASSRSPAFVQIDRGSSVHVFQQWYKALLVDKDNYLLHSRFGVF